LIGVWKKEISVFVTNQGSYLIEIFKRSSCHLWGMHFGNILSISASCP
jgi:hypothetical protein